MRNKRTNKKPLIMTCIPSLKNKTAQHSWSALLRHTIKLKCSHKVKHMSNKSRTFNFGESKTLYIKTLYIKCRYLWAPSNSTVPFLIGLPQYSASIIIWLFQIFQIYSYISSLIQLPLRSFSFCRIHSNLFKRRLTLFSWDRLTPFISIWYWNFQEILISQYAPFI